MIVQNISTNGCPQTIVIGRRGTYDTMQIAFDLSYLIESYGSGTAVLAVKRSQDESAYPAVVTQEDSTILWTVNETDTAYVGSGECQLMWYVEGGLAKTIIYPMVVMRDILSTAEEPPDGYENWIEHLTGLGAETQQNAQAAAQSASEAEQAKDDAVAAKEAAEEAAETAQEAVTHAPIIQNGYWYIWNDGQYVDTGIRAEGQKGDKGDTGEKGDAGNGIASITKTGTSGLVDTYTVTYTDGTDTTFTVTNGAKGDKGDTGATGNGIQSIMKTGTSGNVDTYTITYTNGQTTTFTVTNGAVSSVNGKTGAVNLASGDIAYDESATYQAGSVGAELQNQTRQLSDETTGLDTKAPVILETASGAIASFSDGADSMPVKKLVAQIEPVQDLHGYDSPWPAGGGKNKFDRDLLTDSASAIFLNIQLEVGKTYTFSTNYPLTSFQIRADNTDLQSEQYVYTNHPVTFTMSGDGVLTIRYYKASGAQAMNSYNWQLEEGSTATSFEPYENLCPISGHTGAEIEQSGVNIWDEEWDIGYVDTVDGAFNSSPAYVRSKHKFRIDGGKTYYFACSRSGALGNTGISYYDANEDFISSIVIPVNNAFTAPAKSKMMAFFVPSSWYTGDYADDISINYPATDTTYHPYTGDQISVTFPEAVYSGKVDAITGKLSKSIGPNQYFKTKLSAYSRKDENYYSTGYTRYQFYPTVSGGAIVGVSDRISEKLCSIAPYLYSDTSATPHWYHNVYGTINLFVPDGTDENTEAEFIIPLATAQETQLDPQKMTTLYGTNNIWANTGDVEVTYPADTKLFIEKLTQPTEDDMTSDHAISAGTFFMIGNTLYLATSQIAAGGTITPGTNATKLSLADALNTMNS